MPRKNFVRKICRSPLGLPCVAKHRYASEKAAEKAADLAMLASPTLSLTTYHCPYCGAWHLTSTSK